MAHAESHELGHEIPTKLLSTVLVVLLILTAITVYVAQIDFGSWNIVVAMLIASIKAGLVGMFFMHLKYENPLIWLYVLFPILLLFVMIGGLFIDNPVRYVPGKDSYQDRSFNKSFQPPAEGHAAPADGHAPAGH